LGRPYNGGIWPGQAMLANGGIFIGLCSIWPAVSSAHRKLDSFRRRFIAA